MKGYRTDSCRTLEKQFQFIRYFEIPFWEIETIKKKKLAANVERLGIIRSTLLVLGDQLQPQANFCENTQDGMDKNQKHV